MSYIGIDLGTSGVKMILMDPRGEILYSLNKSYPISYPEIGWSEQNPEDWLEKTIEGLKEILEENPREKVKGICIAGQMHGLVVLDENDKVIRPAILWNDSRSSKESEFLNKEIGVEKLVSYAQNISFPGFTASKILWMEKNEREKFEQIKKIMLPKDYLLYELTGIFATDVSDASGSLLFDVKNRRWSEEMLEICKVKEEQLPKVFESYEKIGYIKEERCKEIGLTESVFLLAGAADNAAAAIGTGAVGKERCNISIGTSGTILVASDKSLKLSNNAVHSFAHSDGKYQLLGCMLSATSSYDWFVKNILDQKDHVKAQEKIDLYKENKLFFLPYLMGERSPHNDPDIRGAFIGIDIDTQKEDMIQSILEGVAFAIRDSMEIIKEAGLEIKTSTICGGGGRSPLWRRILASVLNIDLEVLEIDEGPAYGAAILAAVADGKFESVEEAAKALKKVKELVKAEDKLVKVYEEKYKTYKKLYPALKECFGKE